jgi:hypothetical protein
MDIDYQTGKVKAPHQGSDTVLSDVIIIAGMIPIGCLKCSSQPLMFAVFCPQFNDGSFNNRLFSHHSVPVK